jgi:hypothetical protein
MTLKRRILAGLLIVLMLPVVCVTALYASAWYHRWRAEQLLAIVQKFEPGVTTQDEYEKAIRPLLPYTDRSYSKINGYVVEMPDTLAVESPSEWLGEVYSRLPDPILDWLMKWPVTEGTVFWVQPTFKDGMLVAMRIYELRGSGHPFGGDVEIREGQVDHWFDDIPEEKFNGYQVRRMGLPDMPPWFSGVRMDDRATPEQRRRAMNFKFACFTSFRSCDDGRRVLDPVIEK